MAEECGTYNVLQSDAIIMSLKAGSVFLFTISTGLYSITCLLIADFLICVKGSMVEF